MSDAHQAALGLASAGFFVFPVRGKQPLVMWREQSSIDPEQIDRWWGEHPDAGVAVDCGPSNLAVIDVDDMLSLPGLSAELGFDLETADTLRARTPRGGLHVYFADPGSVARNSQSKLGPGIDVRGEGGYVVAPGTDGYRWEHQVAPALLPDSLEELVVRPTYEAPTAPETAPDVPPQVTLPAPGSTAERWAQALLRGELDAIVTAPQGTGNAALFTAAMKVYGAVKGGYLDGPTATGLMTQAAAPRRGADEIRKTLASAWERADVRHPDMQDTTPALATAPPAAPAAGEDDEPGFDVLTLDQLADMPPPAWIVPNRIPVGLTFVTGFAKSGKTFLTLDMAAAAAANGTRVLWFAGEGVAGFAQRCVAWQGAHPGADLTNLGVVPRVPRLLDPTSLQTFYRTVRRAQAELVVIDTWSRATAGANENDHGEMSQAIESVDAVREAYGCSVVIVHHTNASGGRMRGHTSLDGAADAVWHVEKDEEHPDSFTVTCRAMKDSAPPPPLLGRLVAAGPSVVVTPSAADRWGQP